MRTQKIELLPVREAPFALFTSIRQRSSATAVQLFAIASSNTAVSGNIALVG